MDVTDRVLSDVLIAGLAVRNGSTYSGTVGFHFTKNIMAGYSREMNLSPVGGFVGSTNEITFSSSHLTNKYLNLYEKPLQEHLEYLRGQNALDYITKKCNEAANLKAAAAIQVTWRDIGPSGT